MDILRLKCRPALVVFGFFPGLLGGCAGVDMSDMGQGRAEIECQAHRDNTEYRDCLARANKNYDEWRWERSKKDSKAEK